MVSGRVKKGLLALLLLLVVAGLGLFAYIQLDPRAQKVLGYAGAMLGAVEHFRSEPPDPEQALAPLLGNVYARKTVSLNGKWHYLRDQEGGADLSIIQRGGPGRDRRPGHPMELYEYDFDQAPTLSVPGDWNTQDPSLMWYRGVIWYQREFEHAVQDDERTFLYIGAANQHADVYLNGHIIARHSGGFTPFNVEITQYLQSVNRLVIKVDNRGMATDVPAIVRDWWDYGGLTRDVMLVSVPPAYIENYRVQLARGREDMLSGWVQLRGESLPETAVIRIPELGVNAELALDKEGRAILEVPAQPELWAPATPKLYRVTIESGTDRIEDQIGFRTVATRGHQILLNGEPIFLRGAATHETWLDRPGRAHGPARGEALMRQLKDLNANYVRLAHYPHDEFTLRAADRHGILVWSEIPVFNKLAFDNEATLQNTRAQLSTMILRDQNRASVAIWAIGNETPEGAARNRFMLDLAALVRSLDDSRLLAAAIEMTGALQSVGTFVIKKLSGYEAEVPVIALEDELVDHLDVVGYNSYVGWYGSGILSDLLDEDEATIRSIMLAAMPSMRLENKYDKPLIVSEFGAGATSGFTGSDNQVWTEDYQRRVFELNFDMFENSPMMAGMSVWNLKDFQSSVRMNSSRQRYFNRKGIMSEKGEPKQAYHLLKAYYQRLARKPGENPAEQAAGR